MTHNTPAPGNVLPPGSKLCAGLWHGADCERRSTCARHTEIDTTPGAVMVFASVCTSLGTLGGYLHPPTPAWHDAPTEPGLWFNSINHYADIVSQHWIDRGVVANSHARWYGPIPQDTKAEGESA